MLLFLSRLCGGELFKPYWWRYWQFLSRLCGGEPIAPYLQTAR